jgi:hypothetical protein
VRRPSAGGVPPAEGSAGSRTPSRATSRGAPSSVRSAALRTAGAAPGGCPGAVDAAGAVVAGGAPAGAPPHPQHTRARAASATAGTVGHGMGGIRVDAFGRPDSRTPRNAGARAPRPEPGGTGEAGTLPGARS